MRPTLALSALLPLAAAVVLASPADDMHHLQQTCSSTATTINTSLNGTMMLNTSGLIMHIVYELGASEANLNASKTATPGIGRNATSGALDAAYFNYIDEIGTVCAALQRRGRLFHNEMNVDVYAALQHFGSGVQSYGRRLSSLGLIGRNATIRSFTAGGDVVEAQAAWANNVNYPGKRGVRRTTTTFPG